MKQLPIAIGAGSDILSDANGEPIWPIASLSDAATVRDICELLGTQWVETKPCSRAPKITRSGAVTCVNPTDEHLAKFYAHLTNRHYLRISSISEAIDLLDLAVLIVRPEDLTEHLFAALYGRPEQSSVPGLILADTSASARRQILTRSAAMMLKKEAISPIVEHWPAAGSTSSNFVDAVFSSERSTSIRALLSAGADLLSIAAHSDGIDANLGNGLVLCPLTQTISDVSAAGTCPRCIQSSKCHRIGFDDKRHSEGAFLTGHELLGISDALSSDRRVTVKEIRARLLLFSVCWGVTNPKDIDSRFSLGTNLIQSASLGAFITTWELDFTNFPLLREMRRNLEGGASVGEAVARINLDPQAELWANRFCLFGDPDIRLNSRPVSRVIATTQPKFVSQPSTFLREYFLRAQSTLAGEVREKAHGVLNLLKHGVAKDPYVIEKISDFFFSYEGTILTTWSTFFVSRGQYKAGLTNCACGCSATVIAFESIVKGVLPREIVRCPRCGIIKDAPQTFDSQITVDYKGDVRLSGFIGEDALHVGLLIDPVLTSERRYYLWPRDQTGELIKSFAIPEPWPLGRSYLALICVYKEDIAFACCVFRPHYTTTESPGTYRSVPTLS